ncbi:MAG: hypothetical protein IPO78_06995 [Saprospiraceae bacterium]|nr:hypothetical protein [Saprospiraceae bacterium]MBK8449611.1 hypothetical protein [Saprospiraceae bacterium]MBK9221710.1 hypothetical protein [Saprospiraceae bacterium]MBK9721353.1 hypothetical protein [Saprospiraceae bacterium]MBK9728364.1 hypothetical protein [Saprospiraceae bacterium]
MALNIKEINRKHLLRSDVVYRINYGLCSRLVNFRNGIMYLEVMFTKKWKKNYDETTEELAQCWKETNDELKKAIGCKVYIIDARQYPYKKEMYLHSGVASYDAKKGMLFNTDQLN